MDVLRSPARHHGGHPGQACGERLPCPLHRGLVEIFADQVIDAGDDVVADVRFVAKGRDGIEVSMQFIHVWTTRNGQIVRFRGYPTLAEALEAVGR